MTAPLHPQDILLGAQAQTSHALPVCDHYSGTPERMRKSLALQAQMTAELGRCVFDVTLDCEDGAPVGQEAAHADLIAQLVRQAHADNHAARTAVRVHPLEHPAFVEEVARIVGQVGEQLTHIMLPKVESAAQADLAARALDLAGAPHLPLHVLVESPAAVHHAFEIAAHPRVQSISFGLMDFVSAHGGAIPASAMGVQGQFSHPLVLRAKLEIAAACHAHGKVPSHCVVTEFGDTAALGQAAQQASQTLGYTRMWSIHPAQIRPIVAAFAPQADAVQEAAAILLAAQAADWAPINHQGVLHDRASYRYYWQVLQRAEQTAQALPDNVKCWFS
ncbi:MAG: CoA ester lyase [Comamonas sp.]|nr:CoA ester lyase [Comamonas sp.]